MDTLSAMRTFVEIVDRGSMTAAADALDRSQPAVVRTLAALEQHLGARLLQRTTRRMALTPDGRDYLERCRRILADVAEAEGAVGQMDGEPRGELRITAPLRFGELHVAPAVPGFLARYTAMRVDLMLSDRNVDMIEEGIDLAVRIGTLSDSSMIAVRLGRMRRVVCASPDLVARAGKPTEPLELGTRPCIRMQNIPRQETVWTFGDGTQAEQVRIDGPFGCNQVSTATRACAAGAGFGRFFYYQVREMIADGTLITVLEDQEPEPVPVSLVYPGGRLVSARQRAMIDWLTASVGPELAAMG